MFDEETEGGRERGRRKDREEEETEDKREKEEKKRGRKGRRGEGRGREGPALVANCASTRGKNRGKERNSEVREKQRKGRKVVSLNISRYKRYHSTKHIWLTNACQCLYIHVTTDKHL